VDIIHNYASEYINGWSKINFMGTNENLDKKIEHALIKNGANAIITSAPFYLH